MIAVVATGHGRSRPQEQIALCALSPASIRSAFWICSRAYAANCADDIPFTKRPAAA